MPRDQTNSTGLISEVSQRTTFLYLESQHMVVASSSTGTMGDVMLMLGGWWLLDISAVGRNVSCLPRMLYCTARNLFTPTGTLTVSSKYKQTNRQLLLYSMPVSCKDTRNGS